jgi:hypothetical protein
MSLIPDMATTIALSTLELSVVENVNDKVTSIGHAPNNSGPSAIVGSDLFLRRALPFEVQGPVAGFEIVSLETVIAPAPAPAPELSIWRTVLVITTLAGLAFANSMSIGLITIGLPVIAADLDLTESLLLW